MRKSYILILTGFLSLFGSTGHAQHPKEWCGTDLRMSEMIAQDPNLLIKRDINEQKVREWIDLHPMTNKGSGPAVYTIPVVVHIMNPEGVCTDIISETKIKAAIATLNRDFRRRNADTTATRSVFVPYAADLEIEFKLATIDPNGNCTDGITRSYTDLTKVADDPIKAVSYWDATKYFNIWVVECIDNCQSSILGRAQFPGFGALNTFGFLVKASEFAASNNRTATHEIGHCLSLYHTHQSGCAGACSSSGDYVCDTPQESQESFGCNQNLNDCDDTGQGLDPGLPANPVNPIENYMSYDDCQNMFSLGQKVRVMAAMNNPGYQELYNLSSPSNLIATGVDTSLTPSICADFNVTNCLETVCEGSTISFLDQSSGSTATSWNWDFGNGQTSTSQNPSVVYSSPGIYTVELTAGDGSTTSTKTQTSLIEVKATSGGAVAPFYENFEDLNFPTVSDPVKEWEVINGNNNASWTINTNAAASGGNSYSLKLSSFGSGYLYSLISPTIDFDSAQCTELSFKYAYSQRTSASKEELKIYTSKDCGVNWSLIYAKPAASLSTTGVYISGSFIPTADQWKEETVSLVGVAGRSHMMVKFELLSGIGNYFYIDDINIGCHPSVGIDEELNIGLNVYPNPFEDDANIELRLKQPKTLNLQILDVLGRVVYNENKLFNTGTNNLPLSSLIQLERGVYYLNMKDGTKSITRKIIKM